jgi:hypothetical protein
MLEKFYSTRWAITTSSREIGSDKEGVITNVYGTQEHEEKQYFINILIALGELIGDRWWILGGYFNIVIYFE